MDQLGGMLPEASRGSARCFFLQGKVMVMEQEFLQQFWKLQVPTLGSVRTSLTMLGQACSGKMGVCENTTVLTPSGPLQQKIERITCLFWVLPAM